MVIMMVHHVYSSVVNHMMLFDGSLVVRWLMMVTNDKLSLVMVH